MPEVSSDSVSRTQVIKSMNMEAPSVEVRHLIDDEQMTEYVLLKSLAHKILASHRSGQLSLIKERERLLGQLADIIEPKENQK
jgi:hypothetical protein